MWRVMISGSFKPCPVQTATTRLPRRLKAAFPELSRQTCQSGRRGRLHPHALACQAALHVQNLVVADCDDLPARLFRSRQGLLAARRSPDADSRRDRLGVLHRVTQD